MKEYTPLVHDVAKEFKVIEDLAEKIVEIAYGMLSAAGFEEVKDPDVFDFLADLGEKNREKIIERAISLIPDDDWKEIFSNADKLYEFAVINPFLLISILDEKRGSRHSIRIRKDFDDTKYVMIVVEEPLEVYYHNPVHLNIVSYTEDAA